MKKLLFIFGTRPEAIKLAPLVLESKKYPNKIKAEVCLTGQHKEMLYSVLDLFDIKADHNLEIMKKGQDLYDISAEVLLKTKDIIRNAAPDIVVVHGDTSSASMAALSCFYSKIPVMHVEAGLRTGDMHNPFPEEFNRRLIGMIAAHHFAPTVSSESNLLQEGVQKNAITITGNTVIDALHFVKEKIENNEWFRQKISQESLKSFEHFLDSKFILITGHRRENFGKGFEQIASAIALLAEKNPNINFVYPVHLNPNVQEPINRILGGKSNIHLLPPQNYLEFITLMKYCFLIITDSGGVQEEAPSLGKPVLVMRNTTERPEALEAGAVKLVGTNIEKIFEETQRLIDDESEYMKMSHVINPYGDGKASKRIISKILNFT